MTYQLNPNLPKTTFPWIVVSIYDNPICFMIDTGSDINIIDHKIYEQFKDKLQQSKTSDEILTLNDAATGITVDIPFKVATCMWGGNYFQEPFVCAEMTDVFNKIQEESSIQVHGILGNNFILKHGWVLKSNDIEIKVNHEVYKDLWF